MQIKLDTANTTTDELTGLIALCASLGGRLPSISGNPAVTYRIDPELATATVHPNSPDAQRVEDDVPLPPAAESTEGKAGQPDTPDADTSEATGAGTSTSTASAAVELDADGIPWDERIHVSTKTKTAKNVWTKKRNVDEVFYGQIHAELQELHAGNDDTPPPPTQDIGSSPEAASSTPDENAPTDDTDVPSPPAPDASAGSDAPVFNEFADLVNKVAPFGIPYVKLAELAVKVTDGLVTKFPDLRDKPDYWADFYALAVAEAG
jgi:hypothetical protein